MFYGREKLCCRPLKIMGLLDHACSNVLMTTLDEAPPGCLLDFLADDN